jgi:hypothetical protein
MTPPIRRKGEAALYFIEDTTTEAPGTIPGLDNSRFGCSVAKAMISFKK